MQFKPVMPANLTNEPETINQWANPSIPVLKNTLSNSKKAVADNNENSEPPSREPVTPATPLTQDHATSATPLPAHEITKLLTLVDHETFIHAAYSLILARPPEHEGASYYLNQLLCGYPRKIMLYEMLASEEFTLSPRNAPIPYSIKLATYRWKLRNKIKQIIKKVPIVSGIIAWIYGLIKLPHYSVRIDNLHHRLNILSHDIENLNVQLSSHIINNQNNQLDCMHQFEILASKIDHSIERNSNSTHYHYNKCLEQIEKIMINLQRLEPHKDQNLDSGKLTSPSVAVMADQQVIYTGKDYLLIKSQSCIYSAPIEEYSK